jgi:hypothetical protein
MHFYDDGLFVGEFGVSGTDAKGNRWPVDYSKDGYAGNATCPALTTHDGEAYLYMNDEFHHSWRSPLEATQKANFKLELLPVSTIADRRRLMPGPSLHTRACIASGEPVRLRTLPFLAFPGRTV